MAGIIDKISSIFKRDKNEPFALCKAIIVAGGSSTRMGVNDKLMLDIGDLPAVVRSIMAFEKAESVDEIVLVARADRIVEYAALVKDYELSKVNHIVSGGNTRTESVARGLAAIPGDGFIIAVHDAARPLVKPGDIERCISAARSYHAAALAVPVADTLKKRGTNMMIEKTIDRENVFAVQTPQCFDAALIKAAYKGAEGFIPDATDDCALVESLGAAVFLCEGSRSNIKLTTTEDVAIARAIFESDDFESTL